MTKEEIIDAVIAQVLLDITHEDQTALYELLSFVDIRYLQGYLQGE